MHKLSCFHNFTVIFSEKQEHLSDKIVVVSILGKSPYNAFGIKVRCVGRAFANVSNQKETDQEVPIFAVLK